MENTNKVFQLDIVSPAERIFSGLVKKLFVTGVAGGLEILYGHAPLLAELIPAPVWLIKADGSEEGFVIFGGILEVHSSMTNILADAAIRAQNIDEVAALDAKESAKIAMANYHDTDFDYARVQSELAAAAAQLQLIKRIREAKR